jgi:hypothetical protein
MATYTTRNDLKKPEYTDAADIKDINDNMDFIDGSIAPCEWAKTTAPTVNDDVTFGYIEGSLWFDTTNHKIYICESNADGAAVWRQFFQSGAAISTPYQITSTYAGAPFSIANSTVVTNLNADLLDGNQSSAFAILNGQSGGQSLYGGTGSNESLNLYHNSKDTTGYINIPNGNLVLGTKATTVPNFAMAIHEGAAGAANPIVFVDGDGSTVRAGIWKDSSDNLSFGSGDATTADAYITSSSGKLVDNTGFATTMGTIDNALTSALALTLRPTYANSVATTYYGVYDAIFPEIAKTKTDSGAIYAYYTECMRSHNADMAATGDDGTLTYLIALRGAYGHYNLDADMAGTTTNAYGLWLTPFCVTGTISYLYGLYLSAPSTGGTITNQWPIYSGWDAQSYWAGDMYTAKNMSALSFTDRTPHYDGDALSELKKIKGKNGQIDHDTLPEFTKKVIQGKPITRNKGKKIDAHGLEVDDIEILGAEVEVGRDLSATVTMLVKAVQQLAAENDVLKAQMADAIKRIEKLEKKA